MIAYNFLRKLNKISWRPVTCKSLRSILPWAGQFQEAMQFLNSQAASDVVFVICLSSQQKPFDFPQSSSYIWPSVKPAQCAGSFYILLIFASNITLVLILSLHTFKPIQFCIFKHTHTHTHTFIKFIPELWLA